VEAAVPRRRPPLAGRVPGQPHAAAARRLETAKARWPGQPHAAAGGAAAWRLSGTAYCRRLAVRCPQRAPTRKMGIYRTHSPANITFSGFGHNTPKRGEKCYVSKNSYRDGLCSPFQNIFTQKIKTISFTPNFDNPFLEVVFILSR